MTADRPAVPQDAVPPRKFDGGSSKTGVENLGTAGPSGMAQVARCPPGRADALLLRRDEHGPGAADAGGGAVNRGREGRCASLPMP